MIELGEARVIANQLSKVLKEKTIKNIIYMKTPHKFCWVNHDEKTYSSLLKNKKIEDVIASAHYIRIIIESDVELVIGEDVQISYNKAADIGDKHQLCLLLDDNNAITFKIKLYGFLLIGTKKELLETQKYYKIAYEAIDPLSDAFTYECFVKQTGLDSNKGSVKSALATEQHIPGLGNGVLQDILFNANVSPRKKIVTLSYNEKIQLYNSIKNTIAKMINLGGRDSMEDIYGNPGGYKTLMTTKKDKCPSCGSELKKEAYLGGKVIYCPKCQIE